MIMRINLSVKGNLLLIGISKGQEPDIPPYDLVDPFAADPLAGPFILVMVHKIPGSPHPDMIF
jgi:hypothetical protein